MWGKIVSFGVKAVQVYLNEKNETCDISPINAPDLEIDILNQYIFHLYKIAAGVKSDYSPLHTNGRFNITNSLRNNLINPYVGNRSINWKKHCYIKEQSGKTFYRHDTNKGPVWFENMEKVIDPPPFNPFISSKSKIKDDLRDMSLSNDYLSLENLPEGLSISENNGNEFIKIDSDILKHDFDNLYKIFESLFELSKEVENDRTLKSGSNQEKDLKDLSNLNSINELKNDNETSQNNKTFFTTNNSYFIFGSLFIAFYLIKK